MVQFRNDEGVGQFIADGLAVNKPLHLDAPIFIDDFRFLAGAVRTAVPKMTHPVAQHGAAAQRHGLPSTAASTRISTSSGPTSPPLRPTRSAHSPTRAVATCSSTTPASPASTTPASGKRWPRGATTPTTRTSATSARSTPPSPTGPRGHEDRRPRLPRQLPLVLDRRGRLRLRRRGAVRRARRRCVLLRVRRRALRRLRSPALRAARQAGRPRTGHDQARPHGGRRRAQAAHRRGGQYVPLDQLCLSPQCGFSSTVEGNVLNPHQEVDKLRLVTTVAQDVWGTL